ncbi:unnamed protein product [Ilex paraguariensis]|uniref:Secreted protein n=1 Tax=Ilex paraguariensis TaxID=185542 RepID=A0ABC8UZ86_9AQUA
MGPCGLAGHYGFLWGSWSLIIAVVGSIRFFICCYGQECTVHVNSLISAGLCFQLVFSCSLRFVLRVSPLNAVGSGLKGTAHVTTHGTVPVNSVNASGAGPFNCFLGTSPSNFKWSFSSFCRSQIGNCNRLSKPGIGCPCGGEFAADDCWRDGYHEDSAPRPSY